MAYKVNKHHCNSVFVIGGHAWLSTEHLPLVYRLSKKLFSHFIGPYKVIKQINPVSFKLELPPSWNIHPVFLCSQLKKAQGQVTGTVFDVNDSDTFFLSVDSFGECEVEDLLNHYVYGQGQSSEQEFLVKWQDYPLKEATTEPQAHLTNVPAILVIFGAQRSTLIPKGG